MTCVWDSLIRGIREDEVTRRVIGKYAGPREFVCLLKKANCITTGVRWQAEELSEKQLEENFEWVRDYDVGGIANGHLTSAADPFILLICHVLQVEVSMSINGSRLRMLPAGPPRYTIALRAVGGHMQ